MWHCFASLLLLFIYFFLPCIPLCLYLVVFCDFVLPEPVDFSNPSMDPNNIDWLLLHYVPNTAVKTRQLIETLENCRFILPFKKMLHWIFQTESHYRAKRSYFIASDSLQWAHRSFVMWYAVEVSFKPGVMFALPAASVTVSVWIPDRPDLKKPRCCSTFFSPPDSVRPERWAVCAGPICHIPTNTEPVWPQAGNTNPLVL